MDTLKSYLDNLFASLPKTRQVEEAKETLLANMQDRYNDLKRQGRTENEAIGIVISEFGNIDEIRAALNVPPASETNDPRQPASRDFIRRYLDRMRTFASSVANSVSLFILAPAVFIAIATLTLMTTGMEEHPTYSVLATIALFMLILPGIAIIITSALKNKEFEDIEKYYIAPADMVNELSDEAGRYRPTFIRFLVTGICLCVISPVAVISSALLGDIAAAWGTVTTLVIVAVGVNMIVRVAIVNDSYEKILGKGEYSNEYMQKDKAATIISSVLWPLATAAFLIMGFCFDMWTSAWVVFPVAAVLMGVIRAISHAVESGK